ncbi:MAG: tRNA lysidine(34) synthetase TilS [Flavobacteriales bacterium]|nr:tRNA lysidine(34) synthetase TilS [Flavobacteriales bacterium]
MKKESLYTSFVAHIEKSFPALIEEGRVWLCAVSGGVDSVVLADMLHRRGIKYAVAHCNFHLRGEESQRDEMFVRRWAEKHDVEIHCVDFDTRSYAESKGLSIEMAARDLRYDFFHKLCVEKGYSGVLLAHHGDDQVETILHNFTRGTSIEGLLGMATVRDIFYRTLLPFTREEIERYARENDIKWVEDSTNATEEYTRNKIRHSVIPLLKEINPALCDSVYKNTEHLRGVNNLYRQLLEEKIKNITEPTQRGIRIDVEALKTLDGEAASTLIYEILRGYDMGDRAVDLSLSLEAQSGKEFLSSTHRAVKDRRYIYIEPITSTVADEVIVDSIPATIDEPVSITIEECDVIDEVYDDTVQIYVDKDKLCFPLRVRRWHKGDVFCPWGMGGARKKLSKYLKDIKLPLTEKDRVCVIEDGMGRVLWVVGYRRSIHAVVSDKTSKVLKIKINNI